MTHNARYLVQELTIEITKPGTHLAAIFLASTARYYHDFYKKTRMFEGNS